MRAFVIFLFLLAPMMVWASVGKVVAAYGGVYVERGTERLAVKSGFELAQKDLVLTQKRAKAQLLFADQTVITLGQETRFAIEAYSAQSASLQAQFRIEEGSFRSITGSIGKLAPKEFTLKTKNSTIGIRGTQILGIIGAQEHIACTSGQISVANAMGEVIVNAGEITTVTPDALPTPPRVYAPQEIQTIAIQTGDAREVMQNDELIAPAVEEIPLTQEVVAPAEEPLAYEEESLPLQEQVVVLGDQTNTLISAQTDEVTQSQTQTQIALALDLATLTQAPISVVLPSTQVQAMVEETLPYVDWGVWLLADAPTTGYTPQQIEGYFVAGEQTPTAIIDGLIQNSVTANYNGTTMGTLTTDGVASHATGSVALAIDFGAASNAVTGTMTLGSWNMNIDSATLYNDGFTLDALSGSDIAGSGSGGFYGQGANAVGGSFQALHTNGDSATGVFIGARE